MHIYKYIKALTSIYIQIQRYIYKNKHLIAFLVLLFYRSPFYLSFNIYIKKHISIYLLASLCYMHFTVISST